MDWKKNISTHRAKDKLTPWTAHDLPPLPAPSAVHFAAVLFLFELPTGIKLVAFPADQHLQQWMNESVVLFA